MGLSETPFGGVRIFVCESSAQGSTRLAKEAAKFLRRSPGTYASWLVAEGPYQHTFVEQLRRRLGKRRTASIPVLSTFDAIQSTMVARHRIPERVREQVETATRGVGIERDLALKPGMQLDGVVADEPTDALACAYIAGLAEMDYRHPYIELERRQLPVSVQHIFHLNMDAMPKRVLEWLLSHTLRGVSLTGCCNDAVPILNCMPPGVDAEVFNLHAKVEKKDLDQETERVAFSSSNERTEAILDVSGDQSIEFIRFGSEIDMVDFEVRCILLQQPFLPSSRSSVLFSPDLRTLFAFLDWTVTSSQTAFEMLFEMAGGSSKRWARLAKRERLPITPAAAIMKMNSVPKGAPDFVALKGLSDLRVSVAFADTPATALSMFVDWASEHVEIVSNAALGAIADCISDASIRLSDAHLRIQSAMARDDRVGPQLLGPSDFGTSASQKGLYVTAGHTNAINDVDDPQRFGGSHVTIFEVSSDGQT